MAANTLAYERKADPSLSLCQLLDPEVLAHPYPLYHRLRVEDPVHWDPFLHAWVVTRYADVVKVLEDFSAVCAPKPEQLTTMGLSAMQPVAQTMMRQLLFMDPPLHTQLRTLASAVFTPHKVEALRSHIQDIVNALIDAVEAAGRMDVMADLANRLPALVSAEILGLPVSDSQQLKAWSTEFAEILGNFQHNADCVPRMLRAVEEMSTYFRAAICRQREHPNGGPITAMLKADVQGRGLSEEMVIANAILLMVGAQETTPNLIGNGLLSLLRNPDQLGKLRMNLSLMPSAVEELLRYESPSQHTTRVAPEDTEWGEKRIRKGQSVIAVMGAANRDPERFTNPDHLDICRTDNRHVAFGAGRHFCFGAHLGRLEGQIAFSTMLRRFSNLVLEPSPLMWRENLGLRGLKALYVSFQTEEQSGS
jgi:pimeloyl-[acyl-carrier protein] synthase